MIDSREKRLSVRRQCDLLGICRSSLYYQTNADKEIDGEKLVLHEYSAQPGGILSIWHRLKRKGIHIGRDKVQKIMRKLKLRGYHPSFRKPRTTVPNKEHERYPYLLRDRKISQTNEVWCSDITYIPTSRGFMYLTAVMDWSSRYILSWTLSNTMDAEFCVQTLESSLDLYGTPEVFNSDQGSQYTSKKFTQVLKEKGIAISMNGKGSWLDNVAIERFWWTLKNEYLNYLEYENVGELKAAIHGYIEYYNHARPHQGLGYQTPYESYRSSDKLDKAV